MYSTTDEAGRLNNFAREPKMYLSNPPSPNQKRLYLIQGGLAILLLGAVVSVAFLVS